MSNEATGPPSALFVEISGSYGNFYLSISVVDENGNGIPNALIRILDQHDIQQVKNLRTGSSGSRLHRLSFEDEKRHIVVHVPGSKLSWSRILYGPRPQKKE